MSPLFVWICVLRGPAGHAAESGKFPPEFPRAAVFTAGATVARWRTSPASGFPQYRHATRRVFSGAFRPGKFMGAAAPAAALAFLKKERIQEGGKPVPRPFH